MPWRALLGVWSGNVTKSVVGPRSGELMDKGDGFLVISQPDADGNFYMRQEDFRQLFRVQNSLMQYCAHEPGPFGATGPAVSTAPFEIVPGADDKEVNFCWRGPRLPSHKMNCTGCDCAHWNLRFENGTLRSTFMMSPPAVHLQMVLVKTGHAPSAKSLSKAWPCDLNNMTGNVPFAPAMKKHAMHSSLAATPGHQNLDVPKPEVGEQGQVKTCLMLNAQHNVRLSYTVPTFPCKPCNVTFSLSMDTPTGSSAANYVAVGFKDIGAMYANSSVIPINVSNYWGMAGDNYGDLSGLIVAGYVGKSGAQCVRRMRSESYVGTPTDVPDNGLIQGAKVTADSGQTRVEFTAPFHAGSSSVDINWLLGGFGNNRLMWAMGAVGGDGGCSAPIQYHQEIRGNAPLHFPLYASACLCSAPHTCVSPWRDNYRSDWMLDTDTPINV